MIGGPFSMDWIPGQARDDMLSSPGWHAIKSGMTSYQVRDDKLSSQGWQAIKSGMTSYQARDDKLSSQGWQAIKPGMTKTDTEIVFFVMYDGYQSLVIFIWQMSCEEYNWGVFIFSQGFLYEIREFYIIIWYYNGTRNGC